MLPLCMRPIPEILIYANAIPLLQIPAIIKPKSVWMMDIPLLTWHIQWNKNNFHGNDSWQWHHISIMAMKIPENLMIFFSNTCYLTTKKNQSSTSLFLCEWHLPHFNGLVQDRRNSIANALELHLSCPYPSTYPGLNIPWCPVAQGE